jgi:hypothetical protein
MNGPSGDPGYKRFWASPCIWDNPFDETGKNKVLSRAGQQKTIN